MKRIAIRAEFLASLAFVGGVVGAVVLQRDLRKDHQRVNFADDAYLLPPPEQLERLSLGYGAAVADVIWADVMVSQGLRMGERRRFDLAIESLNAVNQLAPEWRDPYRLAQPLVTLQVEIAPREQIVALRAILERGLRHHPNDAELHLIAGAFIGVTGPNSYLEDDPETAAEWRTQGTEYLARAAELAPGDSNIVWQAMAGDRYLLANQDYERALEMYTTILATTDDPALRDSIQRKVETLERDNKISASNVENKQRAARHTAYLGITLQSYPAAPMRHMFLMPFPRSGAPCAGGARAEAFDTIECAKSWADFARIDPWGGVTP